MAKAFGAAVFIFIATEQSWILLFGCYHCIGYDVGIGLDEESGRLYSRSMLKNVFKK